MRFLKEYKKLHCENEHVRFIGMNSGKGFVPDYSGLPDEKALNRTYIIKGAAGTGKSTIMKKIADHYEDRGVQVVRFLCSSDPDSLDGVLLNSAVLITDGTAPHLKDMTYPGCSSEYVCLSNFWRRDILIDNRNAIERLNDEKKDLFLSAYKLLAGSERMISNVTAYGRKIVLNDKLEKYVERLASGYKSYKGRPNSCIISSFGMKGPLKLDSFSNKAETVISVNDYYGISVIFMEKFVSKLKKYGVEFIECTDPLSLCSITDIYIPAVKTLITSDRVEKQGKIINTQRFSDKSLLSEVRGTLRLCKKCSDNMLLEAERLLHEASARHFELERIYSSAMNFESVNEYTKLLINDIKAFL